MGIVPKHPVIVQRMRAASGINTTCGLIGHINVHTYLMNFLLGEPSAHLHNKKVGDTKASFLSGDVQPLQFSIAAQSRGSVSGDEADYVFIDGHKEASL